MEKQTAYIKEFYTLEQLSAEIGIAVTGLREAIKSGELKAYKLGVRYIVTRDAVKEWLEQNPAK